MTGLDGRQLAELVARVREIVGNEWERPAVGRPHVLPLFSAVAAVLFGLRHNICDEVVAEVFGCSQAAITRYREQLGTILRWVLRPETDQRYPQAQREGALVDGFIAPVGDRDGYTDLYSGKKHLPGQNIQVVADLDGLVAIGSRGLLRFSADLSRSGNSLLRHHRLGANQRLLRPQP